MGGAGASEEVSDIAQDVSPVTPGSDDVPWECPKYSGSPEERDQKLH